jgi:hypothetical protein
MSAAAFPTDLRHAAPALAARLRAILWGLAAVIATRLLRTPSAALLPPITTYLTATARRFLALATHVGNGRLPRKRTTSKPRSGPRPVARPRQHGWLLRHGRHEAAYWRRQLETLLDEPDTRAFLAAAPTAGRLLRPICHLLALRPALLYPPKPAPEAAVPEPLAAVPPTPEPPPRRFATPADLPCPRFAAGWPWRDLLAKNPA